MKTTRPIIKNGSEYINGILLNKNRTFTIGLIAGIFLGACLTFILIIVLSPYRYHTYKIGSGTVSMEQPIREHRITGKTERLSNNGWEPAEPMSEETRQILIDAFRR